MAPPQNKFTRFRSHTRASSLIWPRGPPVDSVPSVREPRGHTLTDSWHRAEKRKESQKFQAQLSIKTLLLFSLFYLLFSYLFVCIFLHDLSFKFATQLPGWIGAFFGPGILSGFWFGFFFLSAINAELLGHRLGREIKTSELI